MPLIESKSKSSGVDRFLGFAERWAEKICSGAEFDKIAAARQKASRLAGGVALVECGLTDEGIQICNISPTDLFEKGRQVTDYYLALDPNSEASPPEDVSFRGVINSRTETS